MQLKDGFSNCRGVDSPLQKTAIFFLFNNAQSRFSPTPFPFCLS